MKKWISILLVAAMAVSLVSCGQPIGENTASSEIGTSSEISQESLPESDLQSETSSEEQEKTMEITVPKTMVTDETPATLTEEQKKMGYTDLKKNEDGSMTYVVKKDQYEEMLKQSKAQAKSDLDGMKTDSNYSTIQDVAYNDDLTEVTILVTSQIDFEQNIDSFAILNAGLTASTYQVIAGNSAQKVTVSVKDSQTGTVFHTTVYPDALNS